MQEDLILVEKKGPVGTISLNRQQKQNALCLELLQQLAQALEAIDDDRSTHVIVLRGAGDRVFSAGYDLDQLPSASHEWSGRAASGDKTLPKEDAFTIAIDRIINHRCPVIAMVHGLAVGGGLDLMASCDLRMADDSAKFMVPAAKRGILYHTEGIRRLVQLVGISVAKEMMFSGNAVDARRALETGLVNHVFAKADLEEASYTLASQIAHNAPMAVAGSKLLFHKLSSNRVLSPEDDKEIRQLTAACFASHDFEEGLRAFREKRQPKFEGW